MNTLCFNLLCCKDLSRCKIFIFPALVNVAAKKIDCEKCASVQLQSCEISRYLYHVSARKILMFLAVVNSAMKKTRCEQVCERAIKTSKKLRNLYHEYAQNLIFLAVMNYFAKKSNINAINGREKMCEQEPFYFNSKIGRDFRELIS